MSNELKTEPSPRPKTMSTPGLPGVDALPREGRFYLLVFEGDRSRMFELPPEGDVLIGRSEGAALQLEESGVSRKHARITMTGGEARISDLDSQNGTFVNGERVVGSRVLTSADVVTICSITLVYHASHRVRPGRSILDTDAFRRRTEEELERSLRYDRTMTLICIALDVGVADRPRFASALAGHLRLIDVVGWAGADQLVVLLPETGLDEAPGACRRMLGLLGEIAPRARGGFTTYPSDGCDVDTLLSGARAASALAEAGGHAGAGSAFRVLQIGDSEVIVADPAMGRLYALIERLASSDLSILICGETGAGKELAAAAVHHWSPRAAGPLVALNCAAIPENLVEDHLFGHERGAFSGATSARSGLLEAAEGGTLLLDEIGELPLPTQAKLLRVLETKRVTRIGDVRERAIDVRIVAATNRTLSEEVKNGQFRKDLFFRLSGGMVWLPPLRDRPREIPILAQSFLRSACARSGRAQMTISDTAMRALAQYSWPGNVRELKNTMDYLAAAVSGDSLDILHVIERLGIEAPLPSTVTPALPTSIPPPPVFRPIEEELRELECKRMQEALIASRGNQTRAAELISMPLRTFVAKLKTYGLSARAGRR
jgi:two-component system, NtrC family, response regulator AtoC